VPSYTPEEPAAWIDALYRREQLAAGYFHIYDGEAVRSRPFPTWAPERHN
jgi:hypothetical protein